MQAEWTVPSGANNVDYSNADVLWVGFQGPGGPGLVQSVLKWEESGAWYIFAEYILDKLDYQTGGELVSTGETIQGTLDIQGSNSEYGDQWHIEADDVTSGAFGYFDVWFGASNLPFTVANVAVLEVHGLLYCGGLPESDFEYFTLQSLSQEGSSWSDQVSVMDLVPFYTGLGDVSPSCSYAASTWQAGAEQLSLLQWAY